MTTQHLDPFEYGYTKGFQDRQNHQPRKDIQQDGTPHCMVFKMGYELGYDHGVAFVCSHNMAQNKLLDLLMG